MSNGEKVSSIILKDGEREIKVILKSEK